MDSFCICRKNCLKYDLHTLIWAPAGIGKGVLLPALHTCPRGRHLPRGPRGNLVKCFVRQLQQNAQQTNYLCITFTTCRQLLGASPQTHTGAPSWTPLGDFRPETPNLSTPGKILRAPMHPNCSVQVDSAFSSQQDGKISTSYLAEYHYIAMEGVDDINLQADLRLK